MAFPSIIQKLLALGNRIQDININATLARNTANDARADVDTVLRKLDEFENWIVADSLRERLEEQDISIAMLQEEVSSLKARVSALEDVVVVAVPEDSDLPNVPGVDNGEENPDAAEGGSGGSGSSGEETTTEP